MRPSLASLVLVVLAGCGTDVSVTKSPPEDADSDGYDATVDCDDAHADTNPDAPEQCDGRDNDCDGSVDEDVTDGPEWYADADGDGHGDQGAADVACEAPDGTVAAGDDCDDADPAVHPGADESDCTDPTDYDCDGLSPWVDADDDGWSACEDCDDDDAGVSPDGTETCDDADVDEDCDGLADDDDPDATGLVGWSRDADGDGYGTPDGPFLEACDLPVGYAADATDCDDLDTAVNPAATEVCEDADVDEDCDGLSDDDDASVDPDTWSTFYQDGDADAWGDSSRSVAQCDIPPGYALAGGDCDDTRADVRPDAPEVCDALDADEDCDGAADDADASVTGTAAWYVDADADGFGTTPSAASCAMPAGYAASDSDCDDGRDDVNPDALEVCDGVDDDCDGLVDDDDPSVSDPSTWARDVDGDGYGDPAGPFTDACAAPIGYTALTTDCDDLDAAVNPAATEVCDDDDDDEDCDGVADDADASVDTSTWTTRYRDADEDGWGDATRSIARCEDASGYVTASGDCDDADAAVSPSATEVCDAADADEDCDGLADDDDPSVNGTSTWWTDVDGDGYGAAAVDACALPAGAVADPGDCDDADATVSPAASEACGDDVDDDCDGETDEDCPLDGEYVASDADVIISGDNGGYFGNAVCAGDFDGDGTTDFAVGEPNYSVGVGWRGIAYVYAGPPVGGAWGAADHDEASVAGEVYGDNVGYRMFALPDLNADGDDELLVGNTGSDWSTLAELFPGPLSGAYTTSDGYAALDCTAAVGAGDTDGDGRAEWWCGASLDSTYGSSSGHAVLYEGYGTTLATIHGSAVGDGVGSAVAGGADVDGDGFDDVFVLGTGLDYDYTNAGSALLFTGPITGTLAASAYDARISGASASAYFASNVALADVSGDGSVDLVAGLNGRSYYVFDGPFSGASNTTSAATTIVADASTGGYGSAFGVSLSTGDADGDGVADVLLNDPGNDVGGTDGGAVWLLTGPVGSGTIDLATGGYQARIAGAAGDAMMYGTFVADVDGDGTDEILSGSNSTAYSTTSSLGYAWFFYGG